MAMEFTAGSDGPIIPNPGQEVPDEQLLRTQAAMEFFRVNTGRILEFMQRAELRGCTGQDTVIVVLDVDDSAGGALADILMPGHDWQRYRDAGDPPMARGLAPKNGLPEFLTERGYNDAARELGEANNLMVLVMHAEVALVMDVTFDTPPDGI